MRDAGCLLWEGWPLCRPQAVVSISWAAFLEWVPERQDWRLASKHATRLGTGYGIRDAGYEIRDTGYEMLGCWFGLGLLGWEKLVFSGDDVDEDADAEKGADWESQQAKNGIDQEEAVKPGGAVAVDKERDQEHGDACDRCDDSNASG